MNAPPGTVAAFMMRPTRRYAIREVIATGGDTALGDCGVEPLLNRTSGAGARSLRWTSNAQHDQRYKSDAGEQHYERDGVVFEPMPITGKHWSSSPL